MIEIILNPDKNLWNDLIKRPVLKQTKIESIVKPILDSVKNWGDDAVKFLTKKIDGVVINDLQVSEREFQVSEKLVCFDLKNAIIQAKNNIEKFHFNQKNKKNIIETATGVFCWRTSRPIEKVGLYIPGGTAPLFSTLLMLGIPAKIAKCKEIIICSPPNNKGEISPIILFVAKLLNLTKVYKVGGAQAIGAMTYGTKTIPNVYKIFGPGNQFVNQAKYLVQQEGVSIDVPAGPSEVLIIADKTAIPSFVAADLLSQAEHGKDSQVILLTTYKDLVESVYNEIIKQINFLSRKKDIKCCLEKSKIIVLDSLNLCFEFSNLYAPEHLILAIEYPENYEKKIYNAGSVFLGNYSCESAGDYASGTNHTLPTNRFALNHSGVSLDSFIKKITFQKLTKEGINHLGKTIEIMATHEGLDAHKNAVSVRLNSL